MLNAQEAIHILQALLPELQRSYGVRSLGVFGSFARGEQQPSSDLDILVEFDDRPLSLFQFVELENRLSGWLGVRVDLIEKSTLKPAIGRRILAEVVPVSTTMSNVLKDKREDILRLAAKHGATNVRVFGSVGPNSDVDFLVDVDPNRSAFFPAGLLADLEDLLGCKVDVLTENALHWYIRDRILKEAQPL